MSDELGGCLGSLIGGLIIIAVVIAVIVYIIIPLFVISMGIGALWGGGSAVFNYATAFRNNVRPEKF